MTDQASFRKLLFMFVTTTNIKEEDKLDLASSASKVKFAEGFFQINPVNFVLNVDVHKGKDFAI